MAKKERYWTFQRLLGVLMISGSILQIYKTITVAQELGALISIAAVHHPQLTAASIYATLPLTVLWWILVAIAGFFIYIDKNPENFLQKAFRKRTS
jgi:hypothetical protein